MRKNILTITMLLCLIGFATACEKNATEPEAQPDKTKGNIVGYIDCNGQHFGIFIITDTKDSLLAFLEINPITDVAELFGWYFPMELGCVSVGQSTKIYDMEYRTPVENEIVDTDDFSCPYQPGTVILLQSPERYKQIILTNFEVIKEEL